MKVAIYTVMKNELKNVVDWMKGCDKADYVVVCDTGSTDGSLEALAEADVLFKAKLYGITIDPFRFDDARNAALALVPADADICIPLDLDERLSPGWRMILEEAWVEGATKARFNYVFSHNKDGSHGLTYMHNRIHARKGYHWKYPDHEGVYPYGGLQEKEIVLPRFFYVEQFQDRTKDRSSILPRLKAAMLEYPNDSRMLFYYGRELYYHGQWREAIALLERYLAMPTNAPFAWERKQAAEALAFCWGALDG